MILKKNGLEVASYLPSYENQKLIVSIDSSKSNSAMVVADEYGEILDDYEMSGKGSDVDVLDFAYYTRKQLKSLFEGSTPILVGIEDIITKKNPGMDTHKNRYILTTVFNSFIFFFQEYHNITPVFINNQSWKNFTLPDEYRTREHHKGSKDYALDTLSRYALRSDDITDAVCILQYLKMKNNINQVKSIRTSMVSKRQYEVCILPSSTTVPVGVSEFKYNPSLTLKQNTDTAFASINSDVKGVSMLVSVDDLEISDIYKYCHGSFSKKEDNCILICLDKAELSKFV